MATIKQQHVESTNINHVVKVGDVVRIINMKGEPQYSGKVGTVEYFDSINQIHGDWGSCAIIPEVDEFEIIK